VRARLGARRRKAAGIADETFNDLRGVTRLAIAGCAEAEIATINGLSLRAVRTIFDLNYLHRDPALAETAIRKLESAKAQPGGRTDSLDCASYLAEPVKFCSLAST